MATVAELLDLVQARLHDDGSIWARDELLRTVNDGYRQFLSLSGAVRRWRPTDLPGRHAYGITQEWEDGLAAGGTVRKPTRAALAEAYQGMSLWEIEALEGITPTDSLGGHTQEWERTYTGDSDLHFRFSFPRNHERIVRLEWANRRLWPIGVRELDESDSRWFKQIGEPRWWTTGAGRVRSVELYEISTTYNQAYDVPDNPLGLARTFAGDRTYAVDVPIPVPTAYATTSSADVPTTLTGLGWRVAQYTSGSYTTIQPWEAEFEDGETTFTDGETQGTYSWEDAFGSPELRLPLGGPRSVSSEDRQYLPMTSDATPVALLGRILEWKSSEDSVMVLEVVVPDGDLAEEDAPSLIPAQMAKYLRHYVLAWAFARPGEGRQPILADHYARRFQHGVELFRSFGDVARADRVYQRQEIVPARRRVGRVRFPAEFPNPWG